MKLSILLLCFATTSNTLIIQNIDKSIKANEKRIIEMDKEKAKKQKEIEKKMKEKYVISKNI